MSTKKLSLIGVFVLLSAAAFMAAKKPEKWPKRVIDAHVHMAYRDGLIESTGLPFSEAEFTRQLNEVNGKGAIGHTPRQKDITRDFKPLRILACFGITKDPDYARIERALS